MNNFGTSRFLHGIRYYRPCFNDIHFFRNVEMSRNMISFFDSYLSNSCQKVCIDDQISSVEVLKSAYILLTHDNLTNARGTVNVYIMPNLVKCTFCWINNSHSCFMIFVPKNQKHLVDEMDIKICDTSLENWDVLKNHALIFDSELGFKTMKVEMHTLMLNSKNCMNLDMTTQKQKKCSVIKLYST